MRFNSSVKLCGWTLNSLLHCICLAAAFHDLILIDELARAGSGGIQWACFTTFGIALPPILNVGSQYLKDLCARDVISGKKIMVRFCSGVEPLLQALSAG